MASSSLISVLSIFTTFLLCFHSVNGQQPYIGMSTTDCPNRNTSNSVLGYSCNGLNKTCQTYLIFRARPPYITVTSISVLLSSDPTRLSELNSVSETSTFGTNNLVIVPVTCSCFGDTYYQSNTTYVVVPNDNYLSIANSTFQGLSTCRALQDQNNVSATGLAIGQILNVPLRCACPTKKQTDEGINYLLSYIVATGDTVSRISERFGSSGADIGKTLEANRLSLQDTNVYADTTLLVPLKTPPSSSQTVSPSPPPSRQPTPSPNSDGKSKRWVYVLSIIGGIVLLMVIGTVIFCVFFRKKERGFVPVPVAVAVPVDVSVPVSSSYEFEANKKTEKIKLDLGSVDFIGSMSDIAQSLKVYSFKELQSATDDFSSSTLIRGSVHRGTINGDLAAIKKVNGDVSKEINLLNKINHFNLIRISGFCCHNGQWYLVYEYAANGPLSDWVHRNNMNGNEKLLSWKQRIQIALDVANGLNYLHNFTTVSHVHKDIKTDNVLLDSEFRAKIANFALARSTDGEEEEGGNFVLTRHIVGTKGYMAPEYLENGLVSTKLDVYSFGVVLSEMITGKDAAALHGDENRNLSDGEENLRELMDPTLVRNYPLEAARVVVGLIDSCLNRNPTDRPTMGEIARSLSRVLSISLSWDSSSEIAGKQEESDLMAP